MFNSISKGSTQYIPGLKEQAKAFDGNMISVSVLKKEKDRIWPPRPRPF